MRNYGGMATSQNIPSSSFSKYMSRMGSSFTTCCAADDRMEARCALKSLDWKYRFQKSSSESFILGFQHRQKKLTKGMK